ncbi:hypothetical protein [Polaromonas naphthalenivorans]|uniref:Uncharacterized protein n=1 Tax=Polaromonas naphthalenivorans (strain CJ2) TaxID=365044 RepID=A1VVM2_POLNA|nr:hypothetical protein [Polaromonas naphthalenivorans]ABM39700.1 hypothetical protein Pnap_4422 [Polaromonas naphthalenivorans CJ2]
MADESGLKMEDHASALALLAEVRDYLMRLPAVPITRQLCRKIDAHLADPGIARVKDAAERALRDRTKLNGALYRVGGPCLSAELFQKKLTLKSDNLDIPGCFSSEELLDILCRGISLELRDDEEYARQVAAAK